MTPCDPRPATPDEIVAKLQFLRTHGHPAGVDVRLVDRVVRLCIDVEGRITGPADLTENERWTLRLAVSPGALNPTAPTQSQEAS